MTMLNEVDVVIEVIDTTDTEQDTHYLEPIGPYQPEPDLLRLRGQVEIADWQALNRTRAGDAPITSGRILFWRTYLDEKEVTLKKGYRVKQIEEYAVDYEIVGVAPDSFEDGRATLVVATVAQPDEAQGRAI